MIRPFPFKWGAYFYMPLQPDHLGSQFQDWWKKSQNISQMMPLHFPSHTETVQYIMTPSLHGLRDQGSSPLSNPFQLDNGNVTGIVTFGMDMWLYFNANFFIDIWDNLSYVFSTYWYAWLELYLACLWSSWNILPYIPPQLFHQFLSHFATPSCWGIRKIMRSLKTT